MKLDAGAYFQWTRSAGMRMYALGSKLAVNI